MGEESFMEASEDGKGRWEEEEEEGVQEEEEEKEEGGGRRLGTRK